MNRLIFVIESTTEGGYVARALGTPLSAQADDILELRDRVHEAVLTQLGQSAAESIGFFDLSQSQTA